MSTRTYLSIYLVLTEVNTLYLFRLYHMGRSVALAGLFGRSANELLCCFDVIVRPGVSPLQGLFGLLQRGSGIFAKKELRTSPPRGRLVRSVSL